MFFHILNVIFILIEVVILFNLLIGAHELGHFLAARWRGLVVERFAIWFGKPIWKKTIGGVEYCLGCIPAGGYVALPQMADMETIEGGAKIERVKLPPITPLDKIIVAFAGPLFSFGLAVLFAIVVWGVGRPMSYSDRTTIIGYVLKDSPAEKAGLEVGDRILEVDGHPVEKFSGIGDTITWRIVSSEGETIPISFERKSQIQTVQVTPLKEPAQGWWQRKPLRQILILPAEIPMVAKTMEYSPARLAGIQPNDEILRIDGNPVYHRAQLSEYIEKHPDQMLTLTLLRKGQEVEVTLKPELPVKPVTPKVYRLGIYWDEAGRMDTIYPNPVEQISASLSTMFNTLAAIISPKSDIKPQHLSGAVGIIRIYYQFFESDYGWKLALWFSVVLNINLAILNLLPIPVLDGGHITLAIIEWLRGKPLSARILEFVQTSCAVLIIGYMLYVNFYDVQDLPWKQSDSKPEEIQFAPKNG